MARFPHFLDRTRSNQIPSNCIWFDTETKWTTDEDGTQHHYLWFGYAAYQRRVKGSLWEPAMWHRFDTIDSFWDWVETRTRKKTRLYLFAHNGTFDLPVMHAFTELPKRGWELKNAIAVAPPLVLTWKKGDRTIRFVDTLNIWRTSLDDIGKSIGTPKYDMPEDQADTEAWERYGRQDVEVIRRACIAWFDFIVDNDLGGFSVTLAAQSFTAYRHRFMPTPIFIDDNEKAIGIARQSYLGGRTECFALGEYRDDFYYVDVNSMYPAVMVEGEYPVKLLGVYNAPTKKEINTWLKSCCMVAEVTLDTDQPIYPIVHDDKLIFPTGEFNASLSTPEFAHAWAANHIKKVRRVAIYTKAPLFKDYIEFMYNKRLEAKAANDTINTWLYKIMMNSLYGKFGQRGFVWNIVDKDDPNVINVWQEVDADDGTIRNMRSFGGIVQELKIEGEARESHPAIASHVTSYARLKLWQAIESAGLDNCFYCDTDSLVVNAAGFEKLAPMIDSKRLGAWALEKRLSYIHLRGPKDYTFDDDTKVKGVRKRARWLSENTVEQDHFVGLKGLLRMGKLNEPVVYTQQKTLKRVYNKGEVLSSGRVQPFRLTANG